MGGTNSRSPSEVKTLYISIYIVPEYRALGIGDSLMRRTLNWMDSHYTEKKVISIAGGNEQEGLLNVDMNGCFVNEKRPPRCEVKKRKFESY